MSRPIDREALRLQVRMLVGDPDLGQPNPLFSDTQIDNAMDVALDQLWAVLVEQQSPWVVDKTYLTTSTSSQIALPSTSSFWGKILAIRVSNEGYDLSSTTYSTGSRIILEPTTWNEGGDLYLMGQVSTPKYFIVEHNAAGTFGSLHIMAPPASTGSSACEVVHVVNPTWGASDSDEPPLPLANRELIALKAAMTLRIGFDMPVDGIIRMLRPMEKRFAQEALINPPDIRHQMQVAGRRQQARSTVMGTQTRASDTTMGYTEGN